MRRFLHGRSPKGWLTSIVAFERRNNRVHRPKAENRSLGRER